MGSKEELFNKNVMILPNELIDIIRGFVGSYYPFIEELKMKATKKHIWYLEVALKYPRMFNHIIHLVESTRPSLFNQLYYIRLRDEWSPRGYDSFARRLNKANKKAVIEMLKVNKVKGRTKLIKENKRNEMITALIKI